MVALLDKRAQGCKTFLKCVGQTLHYNYHYEYATQNASSYPVRNIVIPIIFQSVFCQTFQS